MASSVLVFEWMVGGGGYCDSVKPSTQTTASMMSEGAGMLQAVVEDFDRAKIDTLVLVDNRFDSSSDLPGEKMLVESGIHLVETLTGAAERVDWILLVAPESEGRLSWLHAILDPFVEKLLCPDRDFVELTADKSKTCELLRKAGVRTPAGCRLDQWLREPSILKLSSPFVLKPNDGAGSEGIRWLDVGAPVDPSGIEPKKWRIEEVVSGKAASVSVLCGGVAGQNCVFDPTLQIFIDGHWVDCELVKESGMISRAKRLAERVIATLPQTIGYIGIDFVYGSCAEADTVIEVNPRLTSSYLRLRDHVDFNIAERLSELRRASSFSV